MPDPDRIIELKTKQLSKVQRSNEIINDAQLAGRDPNKREREEHDRLQKELDQIADELRRIGGTFDPRQAQGTSTGWSEGREPEDVLGPEQRVADWVRERRGAAAAEDFDREEFSLGRVLTALVRRDRSFLTEVERRALLEGADASGGFLTPELLASEVIDRLRAKGRTFQAGVRTVPMSGTDQLMFARLTDGVTPAWKSEGAAISEQSMTFDRVTLKVQTLPLLVKISQELFDDLSPEASTVIEDELLSSLARELDRVILRGSGATPEPRGILNQSGVTEQSLGVNGATLNGYSDFATAIGTIRQNNLEPNAAIINAKTAAELDNFKDSTGQPLRRPPSVEQLPFLVSNVIPSTLQVGNSGSVCSEAYVAQWDQVLVGMRTDLRIGIRALDQRYADSLMIGLLCYLRADVAMRHGEAAVVITGVK